MCNLKKNKDMKKHILNTLAVSAMLVLSASSYAQSSISGYFVEGYNQRYQLNPAFAPERPAYVELPGLSNIQFNGEGSVGMSHFIFESKSKPGMLTTFMSSDIDAKDFLDALPDAAQFNVDVNMDILGFGFGSKNWFTTINVKLRNSEKVSLPKDLFSFMKSSFSQGDYLIKDINVTSITYVEYSVAHSHKIGDHLTIGGALKFLEGGAYASLNIDEIDASLGANEWLVKSNGTMNLAVPGMEYKVNDENVFDGFKDKYDFKMPSSYGFAVDLGAEYDFKDIVDGLKISAAITDIGFINWGETTTFATDNQEYVRFEGFENYDVMAKDKDKDTQLEDIGNKYKDMIKLYRQGEPENKSVTLDATFRTGAEYEMPFADWLSFGEVMTLRTGLVPYIESRTSICMSPSEWFDVTGNIGLSTMGNSMGLLLNLHPRGFNFFFAVDRIAAEFNPQLIPMKDFGLSFSLGMNLAFGDKR